MFFTLALLASMAQPPVEALAQPRPQAGQHRSLAVFISPMGEPFRVGSTAAGLAAWFAGADRDHDGALTLVEFDADAQRFFAMLDADHGGKIGFDEIHRYEWEIAPEIQVGWSPGESERHYGSVSMSSGGGDEDSRHGGGTRSGGGGGFAGSDPWHGLEGAGRFGLLNIPEPVAAAETGIANTVDLREFLAAAAKRFALLDTNHDARLTLPELQAQLPVVTLPKKRKSSDARTDPERGGMDR